MIVGVKAADEEWGWRSTLLYCRGGAGIFDWSGMGVRVLYCRTGVVRGGGSHARTHARSLALSLSFSSSPPLFLLQGMSRGSASIKAAILEACRLILLSCRCSWASRIQHLLFPLGLGWALCSLHLLEWPPHLGRPQPLSLGRRSQHLLCGCLGPVFPVPM